MDETTPGPVNAGSDREPDRTDEPAHTAEARRDIERTRAEMSETIEAIQERLSPTNLKEQVMEQVREQVQEAKDAVREATIGKVENIMQSAGDKVYEARRTVVDTTGRSFTRTRQALEGVLGTVQE